MLIKNSIINIILLNSLVFFAGNPSYSNDVQNNEVLERSLQGSHRSEGNRLRDKYRRPVETLTFFGVKPNSNVVEITPGRGWYSEILAPLLKANGTLTAVCTLLAATTPLALASRPFSALCTSNQQGASQPPWRPFVSPPVCQRVTPVAPGLRPRYNRK